MVRRHEQELSLKASTAKIYIKLTGQLDTQIGNWAVYKLVTSVKATVRSDTWIHSKDHGYLPIVTGNECI